MEFFYGWLYLLIFGSVEYQSCSHTYGTHVRSLRLPNENGGFNPQIWRCWSEEWIPISSETTKNPSLIPPQPSHPHSAPCHGRARSSCRRRATEEGDGDGGWRMETEGRNQTAWGVCSHLAGARPRTKQLSGRSR